MVQTFFQKKPENRGEMEIGIGVVKSTMGRITVAAEAADVRLSTEQIKLIALRLITSHEYGHAVHAAKMIQKVEVALTNEDKKFNNTLTHDIAPDDNLQQALKNEEPSAYLHNDINSTVAEKIATGFEEIGTREALIETGLSNSQVDDTMVKLHIQRQRSLRELLFVLKVARTKGLSLDHLSQAILDINIHSREWEDSRLQKLSAGGFGARNFGYYFPLTRSQIAQMIGL